ncbi:MAG: hypothetical protein QOH61_1257 [Chloroflexota bacterium]|jgi:hypothetical protein|nr:hypothetical protein [Chloroflexota bacterium]
MDDRRLPITTYGPCGQLRRDAETSCARAQELKGAAANARAALQQARRDLTRVQHALEEARTTADPARVALAKTEARAAYRRQIQASSDPADRQRAAAGWLREIDRLNREGRRANRMLARAESSARLLSRSAFEAERQADAARIAAESASAACADARQRVAICESSAEAAATPSYGAPGGAAGGNRQSDAAPDPAQAAGVGPTAGTAGQAAAGEAAWSPPMEPASGPLVVEALVLGDRDLLRAVSAELSNLTGHPPSHFLLLLQELLDAVRAVAGERRFLAFEDSHPLWSQFNGDERAAIVGALSDLGFRYDPEEGWYGGRVPGTSEMAMALAYAGHDPRTIRRQLSATELRDLPQSVAVAPLSCLAALAPELTLAQLFELLGPRADSLGALWDDWGRLRPLLLTEASSFVPA